MFPDYLNQYVSIHSEYRYQSFKTTSRHMPYFIMIYNIVFELVENAMNHSEGIGYISSEVSKYQLRIFIGDTGIGLKKGILKNYNLDNTIHNDRQAIEYLFELHNHRRVRKEHYDFNIGAGYGLRATLSYIFKCNGKFIFRTGRAIGSFMNPVTGSSTPSKIIDSHMCLDGTQFMIVIPLSKERDTLPGTTEDFMKNRN